MASEQKPTEINISTKTMFKVVGLGLLFYFLYIVRDVLMILFISLVLASAIDPWVDWLQRKRIPRSAGVVLIYLALFAVLGSAIYIITPPIVKEVGALSQNLPAYQEKLGHLLTALKDFSAKTGLIDSSSANFESIGANLSGAAGSIFGAIFGIFGGIVSTVLVLFITFYMVVEESALKRLVWLLAPADRQTYVLELVNRMQRKIGLWLRGQMILCLVIFLLVWPGLTLLKVNYALVLALIAGLSEAIPYIGPTLGAIPAIFLAFTQSPILAVFVGILYYIIQLVENNILVPKIMQKTVGLNPIISIVVFIIGFNIGGIAGAVLSIPVAAAISVFIGDVLATRRGDRAEPEF